MSNSLGFSLVEVLVALLLASTCTLSLFKHQFFQTKSYQQYQKHFLEQQALNDQKEKSLAGVGNE